MNSKRNGRKKLTLEERTSRKQRRTGEEVESGGKERENWSGSEGGVLVISDPFVKCLISYNLLTINKYS